MKQALRRLAIAASASIAFGANMGQADVPIGEFELGISGSTLQEKLADQNAVFLRVTETLIHARKMAQVPNISEFGEFIDYTRLIPSTEIKASLCDGKVFKIEFTSIYQRDFGALMIARKGVFDYLLRGAAVLTEIKLHQDDNISDVTQTFLINRDALGGAQRGEERVIFALLEDGGPQFNWVTLKFMLENRWYCPG